LKNFNRKVKMKRIGLVMIGILAAVSVFAANATSTGSSPQQAKGEIDGVEDPVEVATPEGFMDKDGEEVTDERSE
jgi:hypothetical protein